MSTDLKERIEKMLAGLGPNADAVAESLRAKGIKGARDNGSHCPIAHLIAREVPEAGLPDADWGDRPGAWFVGLAHVRTPVGDVDTSPPIAEFIDLFDNGRGDPWVESCEYPFRDLDEDAEEEDEDDAGAER